MRLLAVLGLAVVALGVGLWLLVIREDGPAVTTDTPAAQAAPAETPAPAAAPGTTQARRVESVGAEIKRSIAAQRSTDERPPTLAPEGSGSGSARVATPEDQVRWAMMRAVRSLEPAIIECMDTAKKNGETFPDSIAAYGFFFSKKGDDYVLDDTSLEYGPYSDAVNACIKAGGKTMMIERFPEGATKVKVFAKLTVENGEIKNLQMPSFHVLETTAGPVPE